MRRLACVLLALLAGCTLLVPIDGLSGGAAPLDGGPAADGASAKADAAAGPDGTGSDASQGSDAAVDGPFCATHAGHTLCADFDEGNLYAAWSKPETYNGGALALTTSTFVSPPGAFQSDVPSVDAGVSAAARLELDVPFAPNVTVAVAIKRGRPASGAAITLAQALCVDSKGITTRGFELRSSSTGDDVMIRTGATGSLTFTPYPLQRSLPDGAWTAVVLDFTQSTAHVTVDGAPALAASGLAPLCNASTTGYRVFVGAYVYGTAPPAEADFDDVLVDVGP